MNSCCPGSRTSVLGSLSQIQSLTTSVPHTGVGFVAVVVVVVLLEVVVVLVVVVLVVVLLVVVLLVVVVPLLPPAQLASRVIPNSNKVPQRFVMFTISDRRHRRPV